MKGKEQDIKITKIHKNIEGMMHEAKKIVQSNSLLPYINSPNTHLELLLPSNTTNQQLKLLLQDNSNKYGKISRINRKSSASIQQHKSLNNQYYLDRRSWVPQEPLFFNRAAGRYQTSAELSRYQHQLVDSGSMKVARRSGKSHMRKKMINLLPSLADYSKKLKGHNDDKSPKHKYQTISVDSRQIPLTDKKMKSIEYDLNFQKRRYMDVSRRRTVSQRPQKPRCKINSQNAKTLEQMNEEQTYEPWKAENDDSYDILC